MKAYVIIEDYEPEAHEDTLKHVIPYWYDDYGNAVDALHAIARDLAVEIGPEDWRFNAPPEAGIYRDTYYIMELDHG